MVGSVTLLVTPPVAQALLSLNTGNRPMNGAWVEILAERMRRGAWMLTGEPVIVSREGVLNDGQHRLEAVVLSGVAVPMDVRFGVTRAAFAVTGTGKARTSGQMLSIEGHPSALRLAAAASVLVRYARYVAGRTPTYVLGAEVGHDQVKRFVDASPELAVSVRVVGCLGFRPLCNGHGVAAHYISTQHDPEKAAEFWRTVRDGLTTDARSPRSPISRLIWTAGWLSPTPQPGGCWRSARPMSVGPSMTSQSPIVRPSCAAASRRRRGSAVSCGWNTRNTTVRRPNRCG
jgi:hypothetical protein